MNPQTIVADILATGLTQTQLAKLVPCSQSQISSLLTGARGNRISKEIGDSLERLHVELCSLRKRDRRNSERRKPPSVSKLK
jgi:predicted transcriptional regulator